MPTFATNPNNFSVTNYCIDAKCKSGESPPESVQRKKNMLFFARLPLCVYKAQICRGLELESTII